MLYLSFSLWTKEQTWEVEVWKSRIAAIYLLFLTLLHVLFCTVLSCFYACIIVQFEVGTDIKRIIRGQKSKVLECHFWNSSNYPPWCKTSKTAIILRYDTHFWRSKVNIQIVKGLKNEKMATLVKIAAIARLPEDIQEKRDSLHLLEFQVIWDMM